MKNKYRYIFLLFLTVQIVFAQQKDNKFHFYGGIGLAFDNNGFYFSFKPGLMYDINKIISLGTALQYAYGNSSSRLAGGTYTYNIIGYNFLALVYPIKELELSSEYENLYVIRNLDYNTTKYWNPGFFAGVGYRHKNLSFGFKYNFLYNDKSIYHDRFVPYFRIYF